MEHRDAVMQMVDAVQQADVEAFAQLFAEDAVMRDPLAPAPLQGRAAIREGQRALFDAFSEIDVEVLTLLSGERSAAVEVVLRATNTGPLEVGPGEALPATGRRIELPVVWFLEFDREGRVSAERDYFDTGAFMSQLGLGAS